MAVLENILIQLEQTDTPTKAGAARAAVEKAPASDKTEVATAAVQALTPAQQAELQKSLWPQGSADRRTVYVVGFLVAGVIAISLALIAWGAANAGAESVSTAVMVALTGITGSIIGGLFGAYKGQ